MSSKSESWKKTGENSGHGKLLNEIESISKALHLDKTTPRSLMSTVSSRSKSVGKHNFAESKMKPKSKSLLEKDSNKKSIWGWNGIKALTHHVRNKRFNCCFSLQVHSIEGLPQLFENRSVIVRWRRRDAELSTSSVRVIGGLAEFEEQLTHSCSVYGSGSGPRHTAKYEAKHFLLYALIDDVPGLDLGKHRVDLTRLLPLTLEELDEEEKSNGKWTTSYKLSGMAKGATLNVSFGYTVLGNNKNVVIEGKNTRQDKASGEKQLGKNELSMKLFASKRSLAARLSESNLSSGFSESVNILYQKLDEEKLNNVSADQKLCDGVVISDNAEISKPDSEFTSKDRMVNAADESEISEFSVVEKGVELFLDFKEKDECTKDIIAEEMDSELEIFSNLANVGIDHPDDEIEFINEDCYEGIKAKYSPLYSSSESEPESPRERLLRQFEKETLASGHSLFNFDMDIVSDSINTFKDFETESCNMTAGIRIEDTTKKTTASILEDLETEALMQEWGLNERAFQYFPPSSTAFGSLIDLPCDDLDHVPPLGEGLGTFIKTKNGGFLRSMNPELFKNAKNGGKLILQASRPVVVPAEMGSGVMDMLQHLASIGIEKFSLQANKLMPLDDITGTTLQQISWETESMFESSSIGAKRNSEYVSLEDLAPLAMDKIESLSIEGLRIQSGLSETDTFSIGEISAYEGKNVIFSGSRLEGTGGLQLMNIEDNNDGDDEVDGLMGMCLSLEEWTRLDSGEIDGGDEISERTSKLLAAHHATKGRSKRGLLSNNFTVALMVQLRDPLRNYEAVGSPMLTLVQVERVFAPPKPKIYNSVSEVQYNNEENDEIIEEAKAEELIPQYKISEVHIAGLKTEGGKKKLWGSTTHQRSGSRWLIANGMGKKNKHPIMKSKSVNKSSLTGSTPATTMVQPGDTLWSISSRVHGTGAKWEELAELNPHIRNPNVIFPNETVRLR